MDKKIYEPKYPSTQRAKPQLIQQILQSIRWRNLKDLKIRANQRHSIANVWQRRESCTAPNPIVVFFPVFFFFLHLGKAKEVKYCHWPRPKLMYSCWSLPNTSLYSVIRLADFLQLRHQVGLALLRFTSLLWYTALYANDFKFHF